jgi:hypothetical protein
MRQNGFQILATKHLDKEPLVDHDRIDAHHRAFVALPETRNMLAMFVLETGCEKQDAELLIEIAFRAGMSEDPR